jgi:glycerophosphoryl diester phosphodiesterase
VTAGGPIVFAHRGASGYARENTLRAFALALEQGAGGIETDAWLSADGVPVLVHDRVLPRRLRERLLRRAPVVVNRASAEELAGRDVPSLADLYAACGTAFALSVDVKDPAVDEVLVRAAAAADAADRLYVCRRDPARLAALREVAPDVRLVCSTALRRERGFLERLLADLVRHGVDAVNLRCDEWTPERVALVHDAGLLAFGWDAHRDERVDRLVALGVDGLYSDFPDRAVARCARAGAGVASAGRLEP